MKKLFISLILMIGLTSCASTQPTNPQDPYENMNRKIFTFNRKVDDYIYRPIAQVYDFILPDFIETRVTNFFDNLYQIPTVINDVLQLNLYYTLNDTWRFAVNSTLGIGGLFDVATAIDLKAHHQDFGLTLARWGYHPSNYFVIPLLGPSTFRDTLGSVVNTGVFSVWPYFVPIEVTYSLYALKEINERAARLPEDKLLEQAFDPYVFVRNAYLQNRKSLIEPNETEDIYVAPISGMTPKTQTNKQSKKTPNDQKSSKMHPGTKGTYPYNINHL